MYSAVNHCLQSSFLLLFCFLVVWCSCFLHRHWSKKTSPLCWWWNSRWGWSSGVFTEFHVVFVLYCVMGQGLWHVLKTITRNNLLTRLSPLRDVRAHGRNLFCLISTQAKPMKQISKCEKCASCTWCFQLLALLGKWMFSSFALF